ncbi:MAG: ubiquitin-like domain-containing protein [Propionibacteriaceae bacterium]|nr:ubiquitin-like domain-containing protein [Propionibacteriaceae bacterium]
MRKFIAVALASVITGTVLIGWGSHLAFGKTITVTVDGTSQQVEVVYASVAEVLARQRIQTDPRDQISPPLGTIVTEGTEIVVRRTRPVVLDLDGRSGTYWTHATSVGELVSELGLTAERVEVSRDLETNIGLDGLDIGIDSSKDVSVTAAGQTTLLRIGGQVADALAAAQVTYDSDDIVTPSPTQWLDDGLAISVVRVDVTTVDRTVPIPFETTATDDPTLLQGQTKVDHPGVAGSRQETVTQTFHDGHLVAESLVSATVAQEPVTQVERRGTKPIPAVASGEAQQIAYQMLQSRGWGDDQFSCLKQLWQRESGWRTTAGNPSTGAYGIPQALPGSKMASAGADWQTNPATQITWGLGYISQRYGTPCGAWGAFQSKGWY